ncbi:hypothetical protein ACE1CI_22455 [Aerosakkonemataceae cyanobacterium BLCC-F50]|uniref:Uncharacterized protein n=1 Tax=Floridaenema flaviceps BLCC-F50 TaxID=3153642 RepID=A0ABV4XVB7_9CYAN
MSFFKIQNHNLSYGFSWRTMMLGAYLDRLKLPTVTIWDIRIYPFFWVYIHLEVMTK